MRVRGLTSIRVCQMTGAGRHTCCPAALRALHCARRGPVTGVGSASEELAGVGVSLPGRLAAADRAVEHGDRRAAQVHGIGGRAVAFSIAQVSGPCRLRLAAGSGGRSSNPEFGWMELGARGDSELREDTVEVVADRSVRDVELLTDLAIGQPSGGQLGDLKFLRRRLFSRFGSAPAARLPEGSQLAPGILG